MNMIQNKKLWYIIPVLAGGALLVWLGLRTQVSSPGSSPEQPSGSEKIYSAIEGTGEVVAIDAATQAEIRRIDLSVEQNGRRIHYMPHNIQVAPDNNSVWVTANAMEAMAHTSFKIIPSASADEGHGDTTATTDDQVIIIDPKTDQIIKRIPLGSGLHLSHVVISPDNQFAIVAAQDKGMLYKINTASLTVEQSVVTPEGSGPHGLRISPDSATAYIAMFSGKSLGVLDSQTMNLREIPLKGMAVQTAVTANGKYALASVYDAKSLAVYDIAAQTVRYIDLPGEAKGPVQLYPTPDSRFVYVADQGYYLNQPTGDTVYKVDIEEMKITTAIKAGQAPHGVVVSQEGTFVYVTNLLSNDISVIDTATDTETAKIQVGKEPNGISLWVQP